MKEELIESQHYLKSLMNILCLNGVLIGVIIRITFSDPAHSEVLRHPHAVMDKVNWSGF